MRLIKEFFNAVVRLSADKTARAAFMPTICVGLLILGWHYWAVSLRAQNKDPNIRIKTTAEHLFHSAVAKFGEMVAGKEGEVRARSAAQSLTAEKTTSQAELGKDAMVGPVVLMDDFSGTTLDSTKWQSGGRSVSQANGVLTLSADETDNTGWISTAGLNMPRIAVFMRHWMEPSKDAVNAKDYFFPSVRLQDEKGEGIASLVFLRSLYSRDYCDDPKKFNKVLLRIQSDNCVVVSKANSDSYYGRWVETYLSYDSETGNVIVDLDADGVIDLNYTLPESDRKIVKSIKISGYGWNRGHLHKLNHIAIGSGPSNKTLPIESESPENAETQGRIVSAEDMALIPSGSFNMGSPEGVGEPDEHPRHLVYLDSFYIDEYEVTIPQYRKFAQATNQEGSEGPRSRVGNYPAGHVSWDNAVAYCKWVGKRLPTEAEWEKAARGGTDTKWSFGDAESQLGDYAWYTSNSGGETHPVGTKRPNQYGLYDMFGNVWEWVSDSYKGNYYSESPENNPQGPESGGALRVMRGGSLYAWSTNYLRAGYRGKDTSDNIDKNMGFRCAISASEVASTVRGVAARRHNRATSARASESSNYTVTGNWDGTAEGVRLHSGHILTARSLSDIRLSDSSG